MSVDTSSRALRPRYDRIARVYDPMEQVFATWRREIAGGHRIVTEVAIC